MFDMNGLIPYVIISVGIAFFVVVTRPSQDAYQESNVALFVKVFIISFVCVYFGMMFLTSPSAPEINMTEPDF